MSGETEIRPFRVDFPEEELAELRRRVAATRWPERETVTDDSQGVRLAMMQDLARYWATDYDWRRCEPDTWGRRVSSSVPPQHPLCPGRARPGHPPTGRHRNEHTLARARRAARGLGPAAR